MCQRPEGKTCSLLWEFVGGKVESGETKEDALIRECKEELDVIVEVGDIFMEVVHEYSFDTIHLTLYNVVIREGIPKRIVHTNLKWITINEILQYEFCPADTEILEKLMEKKQSAF
jgi:mutator protein MutT